MRARDSGIPVKEAQVFATVYVARNPSLPVFTPAVYRATIKEDHQIRTSILRVTASDADGVSFSSGGIFVWRVFGKKEKEEEFHSLLFESGLCGVSGSLLGNLDVV